MPLVFLIIFIWKWAEGKISAFAVGLEKSEAWLTRITEAARANIFLRILGIPCALVFRPLGGLLRFCWRPAKYYCQLMPTLTIPRGGILLLVVDMFYWSAIGVANRVYRSVRQYCYSEDLDFHMYIRQKFVYITIIPRWWYRLRGFLTFIYDPAIKWIDSIVVILSPHHVDAFMDVFAPCFYIGLYALYVLLLGGAVCKVLKAAHSHPRLCIIVAIALILHFIWIMAKFLFI